MIHPNILEEVTDLYPQCFPIGYKVDVNQLLLDCYELVNRLGIDYQSYINATKLAQSINLTHLPNLQGTDRWKLGKGNHPEVLSLGMNELEYTEHLQETQDLYLGKLVHEIYKLHKDRVGTDFQGRAQLVWLHPKQKFHLHNDPHTPHRYHVPIITNEHCFWLFKSNQLENSRVSKLHKLHMPVGDVWYVDPVTLEHTFVNNSSTHRLHLLLTSGL
jgi:hypothetical protein